MNHKFTPTPSQPHPDPACLLAATARTVAHKACPIIRETLLELLLPEPLHRAYSKLHTRLFTFEVLPWSLSNHPDYTPQKLAEAGFINLGFRDLVQCFHCDGIVGNWEEHKLSPWAAHAAWHPHCSFLWQQQPSTSICGYWKRTVQQYSSNKIPETTFPWGYESSMIAYNFLDPYINFSADIVPI